MNDIRSSWKFNTSTETMKELLNRVIDFIEDNEIKNEDDLLSDMVEADSFYLIEDICNIVGYYWEE